MPVNPYPNPPASRQDSMHLPLELVERVIDYSHDDLPTLGALSLVSKAFTPRSRFHLWQRLTLTPASTRNIFAREPFKSPKSAVYRLVSQLTIDTGFSDVPAKCKPENISILERFTSVRTLHTIHFEIGEMPNKSISRFHRAFPALTQLVLSYTQFRTSSQFAEFMSNVPRLRRLALYGVMTWMSTDTKSIALPPAIKELEMENIRKHDYIDQFLVAGTGLTSITNLHLQNVRPDEINSINRLLQAIGPTLERVIFHYLLRPNEEKQRHTHRALSFGCNSRLRNVLLRHSLFLPNEGDALPWIGDLLLLIESPLLESVELELMVQTMKGVEIHGLERTMSWLSGPRFPNLRTVSVGVLNKDLEGQVRQLFRGWNEAGVLTFKSLKQLPRPMWGTVRDYV